MCCSGVGVVGAKRRLCMCVCWSGDETKGLGDNPPPRAARGSFTADQGVKC
jgi:hypothetical protein